MRWRINLQRHLSLVAFLCMALSLAGCSQLSPPTPQDLIVGKWQTGQGGIQLKAEFAKDGTAWITMFGQRLQGTYALEGEEMVWSLNGTTTKHKFKVTKDELDITGDGGAVIVYKRDEEPA